MVQLCIHFSTALCVVLKNPVIFNGYRSQIHSEETIERRYDPFKLYLLQKNDQKSFCRGLELLEENLLKIKRSLNQMKERENIGYANFGIKQDDYGYPNRIIKHLHVIAEF